MGDYGQPAGQQHLDWATEAEQLARSLCRRRRQSPHPLALQLEEPTGAPDDYNRLEQELQERLNLIENVRTAPLRAAGWAAAAAEAARSLSLPALALGCAAVGATLRTASAARPPFPRLPG